LLALPFHLIVALVHFQHWRKRRQPNWTHPAARPLFLFSTWVVTYKVSEVLMWSWFVPECLRTVSVIVWECVSTVCNFRYYWRTYVCSIQCETCWGLSFGIINLCFTPKWCFFG
jgi:hypothetical protein